jgi:hypothetical protein
MSGKWSADGKTGSALTTLTAHTVSLGDVLRLRLPAERGAATGRHRRQISQSHSRPTRWPCSKCESPPSKQSGGRPELPPAKSTPSATPGNLELTGCRVMTCRSHHGPACQPKSPDRRTLMPFSPITGTRKLTGRSEGDATNRALPDVAIDANARAPPVPRRCRPTFSSASLREARTTTLSGHS